MSAVPAMTPRATDLLLYARDPGAANVVIAAHAALSGKAVCPAGLGMLAARLGPGPRCAIFAKAFARNSFAEAGLPAQDWARRVRPDDREGSIARLLDELGPIAILTGTSDIDDDDDILLWRQASRRGIASYAVVDSPASMKARFTDRAGRIAFPTKVLACSAAAASEIVNLGARPADVVVSGQIHLDLLKAGQFFHDGAAANRVRVLWGAGPGEPVVLFASECGREMAAAGRPAPYDEIAVLEDLVETIERGAMLGGIDTGARPPLLIVRPHPRDAAGKFDAVLAGRRLRAVVSGAGAPAQAVMAADLVVGMNSMLLHEAKALGRPVLSLVGLPI